MWELGGLEISVCSSFLTKVDKSTTGWLSQLMRGLRGLEISMCSSFLTRVDKSTTSWLSQLMRGLGGLYISVCAPLARVDLLQFIPVSA